MQQPPNPYGQPQPGYAPPPVQHPYGYGGLQPQGVTAGRPDPFAYDKFLLNQKVLSLGNKYFVYNEASQPLFFVDRPVLRIKSLFTVYADESRQFKLLTLNQDSAWTIMNYGFTLRDHDEQVIGYLKRQGWMSILRRTWRVYNAHNQEVAMATEDSWWKAILRRVSDFGAFFRTNFNITRPDGSLLGEHQRRFTLMDKYVMDLTQDPQRTLDRRLALALAIVLDNTEHR